MKREAKKPSRKPKDACTTPNQDRRNGERRKIKSKGYLYISTVGWMDRRETRRRLCASTYRDQPAARHGGICDFGHLAAASRRV